MNLKKIGKSIFLLLLLGFTFLFIASNNGYYEYQRQEKVNLTKDAIARFEQDIKDGKKVDIKDYLPEEKKNYENKITKINQKISKKIEQGFSSCLKLFFKYITSSLEEETMIQ